ncbi:MFS transporter [Chloroflexota bacterium]
MDTKPKFFYGYVIVLASFVIMATMMGVSYSFGVFFKPLLEEFGWTRAVTSGAFSLSLVVLSIFIVVVGKLNDRFGPRIILSISGLLLGIGYILLSQITNIWQLYVFYGVIVGAGMSTSYVPIVSTVARWFVKRRGMMTGITVSGLGVGTLIMPPLANWFVANYGWRTSYMIVGIACLILIILAAQLMRRDPGQMRQVPYGEADSRENLSLQPIGFSFKQAVHTKQLWMLGFAVVCFSISLGSAIVHIVLHAIGLGISATSAANILAIIGGVGTVSRIIMGSAYDRIGNKLVLIVCFILILISVVLLLVAKEIWMLYLFATIFALGYGGIAAVMSPTIAKFFGLSSHGAILGVIVTCGEMGKAIGSVLTGYIFDVTRGYQAAFILCLVLSIIGLSLIIAIKPIDQTVSSDME